MSIDKSRNIWVMEYPDGVTLSENPETTKQRRGIPNRILNAKTWSRNEAMQKWNDLNATLEIIDEETIQVSKPKIEKIKTVKTK